VRSADGASDRANDILGASEAVADLERYVIDAETGMRGYVITGQPVFLAPTRAAQRNIPEQIGISQADMRRLFERFFRTQRATAAAIPGVGLGLTIAQAIVHGHEGRLAVESAEGAGTTFRIDLPLHRVAEVRA
jgi:hypothetical protein